MKTNTKRFGRHKLAAMITVLSLLTALVLPAGRSFAAPDTEGPVDLEREVGITVVPSGDDEMNADLGENAELVFDFYKIADAVGYEGSDGYTFAAIDPFKSLESAMKDTDITAAGWQQVAQEAATIVLVDNTSGVQSSRVTIEPGTDGSFKGQFNSGLYLVIAHGKDVPVEEYLATMPADEEEEGGEGGSDGEDAPLATMAKSSKYYYYFLPELVALPGRDITTQEGEEGEPGTLILGLWDYDVVMTLKPKRELGVGPLRIVKNLDTYENHNEASFVFKVEIWDSDPDENTKAQKIYSSAVALSFDSPGTGTYEIDDLPIGACAKVSEVYSGEDYKLIDPNSKEQKVFIEVHEEEDDDGNTVELIYGEVHYENTYNKTIRGGGSVFNMFTHSGEEGASWQWEGVRDDGTTYGHPTGGDVK